MVRGLLIAAAVCLACPAAAQPSPSWTPFVDEAARRFGLPSPWIWRVIAIESRGRTTVDGRPIRSPKGAMGLMQLMPVTWQAMRASLRLGSDPDDPHDNIIAGSAYLRLMYDRFGYPGMFAAYNAGPARYAAYLAGRPLPAETVAYMAATGGRVARVNPTADRTAAGDLLFAIAPRATLASAAPSPSPGDGLLVVVRR